MHHSLSPRALPYEILLSNLEWGPAMSIRVCNDGRSRALTFTQLLQRVVTDDELPKSKKHDVGSNIRTFIRLTGADPSCEPATFQNCRNLTVGFSAIAHQITPQYW